jgi:predicted nuclease with RNAse H fold
MEAELKELLERGITALEELAKDPVIQVETHPPVCPHCEQVNPVVRVQEHEAEGPLAEFVIRAVCLHCHKTFYAIPVQMISAREISEASALVAERIESGGYNGGSGKGT